MNRILKDLEIKKITNKKIVLVGGCFDILHPSHHEFLKRAKQLGNILVVLLESDENIRKLKGKGRPVNNQFTRAQNLSNSDNVDHVILLSTPNSSGYYYNLVKSLRPDIIAVTKGDPFIKVKKDQAKLVGGKVVEVMERNLQHSSTELIEY